MLESDNIYYLLFYAVIVIVFIMVMKSQKK